MNSETVEHLRSLMTAPAGGMFTARVLAICLSAFLVITVLWLVRQRKLREEYTPIWMSAAVVLAVLSFRFDLLYWITDKIGAWTPSSTLFFFGEVFLTAISLNYAVRLSRTNVQLKNLAQEVALLKAQLGYREEARIGSRSSDEM